MYCPECGEKIPEKAKFCPMCGLNISEFYRCKFESQEQNLEDNIDNTHKDNLKRDSYNDRKDDNKGIYETKQEKARRFDEILKNAGKEETNTKEVTESKVDLEESISSQDLQDNTTSQDFEEDSTRDEEEAVFQEEEKEFKKENPGREFIFQEERESSSQDQFKGLGTAFSKVNNQAVDFIYSFIKKFIKALEEPGNYYRDICIILSALLLLITNIEVIRRSSPEQTLSFNRFLITIVVSLGALAIIILKPYVIMTFDKKGLLKPIDGHRKFSSCVVFATLVTTIRLFFHILFDFVPGTGLMLGYTLNTLGLILYMFSLTSELLIVQSVLKDKWKNKRDIRNTLFSSAGVIGLEIISILFFRPLITMMIERL